MTEGFVLTRVDGGIFLVNQQFLEMFDLTWELVAGKTT